MTILRENQMSTKTYSDLIKIDSFQERFNYLRIGDMIGERSFGGYRYLNQKFYQSDAWKRVRRFVILRDNGSDLAHGDYPIGGRIYIHHIEPITPEDIMQMRSNVIDPENLVCVSFDTHNAIHFGAETTEPRMVVERSKYDTCPWR